MERVWLFRVWSKGNSEMKEGWTYKKFDEVFYLQMGKTPSRDNSNYWGGDNVWVSIADLQGKYIDSSKESISDAAVSETGIKLVPKDTVIMSFKLSVGRSAITTIDLYTNEAIMAFTPRSGFDIIPDYIYYYLKGYKWQGANKAVKGMTLNKKSISENTFVYPDYGIQQEIVSELDLLSGVIEKQKAQLEELDKLAQSIFYDMFEGKEWEMKTIKEIAFVRIGPFGSALHQNDYISGGTPLVNPIHMRDGKIYADNDFTISDLKKEELSSYLLKTNDIVFGRRGDIGRCALVTEKENNYLCGTGSLLVRFNININPLYSIKVLSAPQVKQYLLENARGATMLNLNSKIIEGVSIPLPPITLQQEFAAKIEAIESMKAKVRQSLKELEELFNSRMDYYFN